MAVVFIFLLLLFSYKIIFYYDGETEKQKRPTSGKMVTFQKFE